MIVALRTVLKARHVHNSNIDDDFKSRREDAGANAGCELRLAFKVITDDRCRTVLEPAALPAGHIFVPTALFVAEVEP